MMKKKVKKIPKYYNGELAVGMPDMSNYKIQNRMGITPPSSSSTISYSGNENWADMTNNQKSAAVANAIGGGADLINMATSGHKVTAGTALSGIAKGASAGAIFGPIGAGVGAALGAIAGTAGRKHGYDKNSASTNFDDIYQEGSGWLSWFGPSSHEAKASANRIQSGNIAKIQTEGIKADYVNNPNVQVQPILAAEGGTMRKPVDALVSKGELIYNPTTKKLSKVPGSNGKPNKKDDVYARLNEGDMVISNSPTMVMANGKTPAQNLEGLVDSNKNVKAKEAIIKKVVNWQEANKTKPTSVPKYEKGTTYVQLGKDPIAKLEEELFKPQTPEITGKDRRWVYHLAKAGETMSDYLPMASALLKDYDYQRVQPRIGRNHNIPVDYNINDILVDNQQAHAINNYNVSQMGGSTGAYLAAAGQSASNLAKANSKARIYQKNKQNELIARNITQLNDWERYANNQLWAADVATAQNQGMAQQMRDQAIKDAYEYQTGRRNDRWKLSMLEPLFKYAVDDNIWKNFKIA